MSTKQCICGADQNNVAIKTDSTLIRSSKKNSSEIV